MNTERLFFLREEHDLTQEDVGKIVGTKKFSVCNWESGKEIIKAGYATTDISEGMYIDGQVSRKKQIVPAIISGFNRLQ